MLNWRRGGVNLPWAYVHPSRYETIWCGGFPEIYAQLEGVGQSAMMTSVYVYCTIYATALV